MKQGVSDIGKQHCLQTPDISPPSHAEWMLTTLPKEILVRIWADVPRDEQHRICFQAAQQGDLTLLRWLVREVDAILPRRMEVEAARQGQLPMVQYLYRHHKRKVDLPGAMHAGAAAGMMDIVLWCHEAIHVRPRDVHTTLTSAASKGHLSAVKWLVQTYSIAVTGLHAFEGAARHGHLDIYRFLHENCKAQRDGIPFDVYPGSIIYSAAEHGHVEVVNYLLDKCSYDVGVLRSYLDRGEEEDEDEDDEQ